MANEKQKEFWSGNGGKVWVEKRKSMDRTLFPLGEKAFQNLVLSSGADVLDIGCGCGATTVSIARRVLPNGKVTGVDISAPMLTEAVNMAEEKSLSNVRFINMDVQTNSLEEGRYSAAYSRFGVMFFEDAVKAFQNINRGLRSEGLLSFVCWQSSDLNPWQSVALEAIRQVIELPPFSGSVAGPFAFREQSRLREVLVAADFQEISVESFKKQIIFFKGRSVEECAIDYLALNPSISELLTKVSDSKKSSVMASIIGAFKPFYSSMGLVFSSATWIVTAKKKRRAVKIKR